MNAEKSSYDAVVIGSGPNGLAAAITLARRNLSVLVVEAKPTIGGGMRTAELTLPGFRHDVCSAVHPMAVASPFFRSMPLAEHGCEFIHPPAPLAHPLAGGNVVMLERTIEATSGPLGYDGEEYRLLFRPLVEHADDLIHDVFKPPGFPRHPLLMAKFGLKAIKAAEPFAAKKFRNDAAKALFAGNAAHSILPLDAKTSAAVALMLMTIGHSHGWPIPKGGSQSIADAMASYLRELGGEIATDRPIKSMNDLPKAKAYLFDILPEHVAAIAGDQLPEKTRTKFNNHRHGPGIFKLDWALSSPIPWKNEACLRAATVHVGGTLEEIAASEKAAWSDTPSEKPFVLVAQQSLFDDTRAPKGKHTGWGYCHVPRGCTTDMTAIIEKQIERFAPGFRDTILARHAMSPSAVEAYNANYVGGDIGAGVLDFTTVTKRLATFSGGYATPNPAIYLCAANTHPGPGVHGMCGVNAAAAAIGKVFQ